MPDSTLLNLTHIRSNDIITPQSLFMLGELSDGTPVRVPVNELQKRVGIGNNGVLLRKVSSQTMANDATYRVITGYTPYYDDDGYWNSTSSNVIRIPNSSWDGIFISWGQRAGLTPDIANSQIVARIRWTSATSNKYGYEFPLLMDVNSVDGNMLMDQRQSTSGHLHRMTYWNGPFKVESGDQIEVAILSTVGSVVLWADGYFGVHPFGRRRQ